MNKNIPNLPEFPVSWWQDGKTISDEVSEPFFLSAAVRAFFNKVYLWLLFPIHQMDALSCNEELLNLIAWDRDIKRFDSEPLSLFRKRVKFAAVNAKDAGSVAGFKRIFERLGIAIVSFKEREDDVNWDVCTIELTDNDISNNSKLVQTLIMQYGRTCRRYRFEVLFPVKFKIAAANFAHQFQLYNAAAVNKAQVKLLDEKISHQQQVYVASLCSKRSNK